MWKRKQTCFIGQKMSNQNRIVIKVQYEEKVCLSQNQ